MIDARRNTHYTVVIVNVLIAVFLVSIPIRRWSDQVHLARMIAPETSGIEVGIKTIRESLGFFLLSLLAIWGSIAEIRRQRAAVWLNVGVPVALLTTLAIEYALHRNDHPEENGIALIVTVLPISIILLTYATMYLRDRYIRRHEH